MEELPVYFSPAQMREFNKLMEHPLIKNNQEGTYQPKPGEKKEILERLIQLKADYKLVEAKSTLTTEDCGNATKCCDIAICRVQDHKFPMWKLVKFIPQSPKTFIRACKVCGRIEVTDIKPDIYLDAYKLVRTKKNS